MLIQSSNRAATTAVAVEEDRLDHVHRHADGGPTTLANGRGLCARGNYVREMPGWTATITNDGRHSQPHTVTITTPTGHSYTSSAPQPP